MYQSLILLPLKNDTLKTVPTTKGISILGTVAEVFEKILERIVKKITEPLLAKSQNPFRGGREIHD